jgi:hypothetical protein
MKTEAGDGLATTIDKDACRCRLLGDQGCQDLCRGEPEWAVSYLASLATNTDRWRSLQVEIFRCQLSCLVSPCSGVVQKK